jgi:hypothetical protein
VSFQVNETNSKVTVDETVTTLVVEDKAARVTITGDGTEVEITAPGPQGPVGPGFPEGGVAGQLIVKDSSADYDVSWTDEITLDKLTFDTAAGEDLTAPGELAWDAEFGTLDVILSNGDDLVTMHVGQDIYYRVKNASGVTLTKGTLVMATTPSGSSGKISVVKAVADGSVPSQYIMGVVAEEILADSEGFVVHFGRVRRLNTQTPNWNPGDILWADPAVPGGLTKVEPAAPNSRTIVAIVLSRNTSNGAIFVRPTYGSDLADDERVRLTNITNGQALIYNGTVGVFENVSLSASNVSGVVPTTRQVGSGTGLAGGGDLSADRTLSVLYGSTAGTAAQGNDARLSDARTPLAHAPSHHTGGSDPLTATNIGAAEATTQVIAGTGLSGGGTLEANRTFAVLYGTTAGTSAQGNDARLSDARTPTAHASTHFTGGDDPINATNIGAVPEGRQVISGTGLAGGGDLSADRTLSVLYGTTSGTAAQGNDARLSDARTPTAHASTHFTGGSDPLTATNIGAAQATTQIIAGTGLTGGGTLEADRTLTVLYGTTSGTAAQGNDARLSDARTPTAHASTHFTGGSDALTATNIGAVPSGRQVIAGTGLTGGGDLSADRTLTVLYGTTSGTAASGDRGLPTGGTTGQVLAKSSATDYAVSWVGKIDQMPSVGREPDANILIDMYSLPGTLIGGGGNRAFLANRMHMWPFPVNKPVTITKYTMNIVANSTVVSNDVRVGIYSLSDDMTTTSLVQELPVLTLAAGATGFNITTLATPLTLQPGMYGLAWNNTAGNTITFRGGNNVPQGYMAGNHNPMAFIRATGTTSASSAMPSTFPTPWRMETEGNAWGPMAFFVWTYA